MTNMRDFQTSKAEALAAYKKAKVASMETVSRKNIKGNPVKWAHFCSAKTVCMLLGIIL